MERFLDGDTLPGRLRGAAVALGNFDGFHVGHQAVVTRAMEVGRSIGGPALVTTFEPHPRRLFHPELPPFALTTLDQKLELLGAFGADGALVKRFDAAFASTNAEDFVRDWLIGRWGVSAVVMGEGTTFGARRGGTIEVLTRLAEEYGFVAEAVRPVELGGEVVSSSRIRSLLQSGDARAAAGLLTRPFAIRGVVEHGDKRGRTIGFPTANLRLGDYLRPAYGVYAVRVRLQSGATVDGVANVGIRPMFEPPVELLEVHLFDFGGELYGREIEVELVDFIRPEWRLDGLEALQRQIASDCVEARRRLAPLSV
jgi:riboflavin kinase/FMN adenylyltransferase